MELLRPVAARKGVALELEVADLVPVEVVGDSARVRQVVLNLLGNAVKFTQDGEVRVRLGAAATDGGTCVTISVADTGIGIAADRLEAVFENFTQADRDTARRFGGTGLGLAISRKIARGMGGEITVQSVPGTGTTFTATVILGLPKAEDRPDVEERGPEGDSRSIVVDAPAASGRILVVDDNRTNRFVIEKMLADTGYTLDLAVDGPAALSAATAGMPDLVLMDISMPGMDGFEACRRIRGMEAETGRTGARILALTANDARTERLAARDAGMDGFLTKPIRKAALLEAIEAHVEAIGSGPPGDRAPSIEAAE